MHLGLGTLRAFFEKHQQDDALVLATVIATEGSTYRKPGAMMLICESGQFAGMISGGCLEHDLLEHTKNVFATGLPARVSYDMYADEQLVWSLGLGCDGAIHLLLIRLEREQQFGFLPTLFAKLSQRQPAVLGLVVNSEDEMLPPGSFAYRAADGEALGHENLQDCLDQAVFTPGSRYQDVVLPDADAGTRCLLIDIQPVPRVLVCGGGPDALPVVRLLVELGWDAVIADHRSAYARVERFPGAAGVINARPENLDRETDLGAFDAALIMSHHLRNDGRYLQACLGNPGIRYVGILGPASRRRKLLAEAGQLGKGVFGPVGLDIGAELPEAIALSAVAEIHAILNGREGGSLTEYQDHE